MLSVRNLPAAPGHRAPPSEPEPDVVFGPAGGAEEKTGGRAQVPRTEVCLETPGPPGPLGGTRGGRGGVIGHRGGLPSNSDWWPLCRPRLCPRSSLPSGAGGGEHRGLGVSHTVPVARGCPHVPGGVSPGSRPFAAALPAPSPGRARGAALELQRTPDSPAPTPCHGPSEPLNQSRAPWWAKRVHRAPH